MELRGMEQLILITVDSNHSKYHWSKRTDDISTKQKQGEQNYESKNLPHLWKA